MHTWIGLFTFQPQFREAFGLEADSDSDEGALKADIERLMTQAKFEAVMIAERNFARFGIILNFNSVRVQLF